MILAATIYLGSVSSHKYLKCCIGCESEYFKKKKRLIHSSAEFVFLHSP